MFFNFAVVFACVLLVLWGFFMDMEKAKRARLLALPARLPGAAWDWGARTSWEILFSVGWLGMVQINEYAAGLICLALFAFGVFSRLMHSTKAGAVWKIIGGTLIPIGCMTMFTTTLANKGDKPWSPTLALIDAKMAARVPLPSDPDPLSPSPTLPANLKIERTSQAVWIELAKQISASTKALNAPQPLPVTAPVRLCT